MSRKPRGPRLSYTPRPKHQPWEALEPEFPTLKTELAIVDPTAPRRGVPRNPSPEAKAIVARMSGYGFSVAQISKLTGYRPSTLYRAFRHELTTAGLLKDLDVLESAYHQAVGGPDKNFRLADPSMTRLWLGHRLGWKPPNAFNNPRQIHIDLDKLSDDELHELDRILERAGDADAGEGGAAPAGG